MSKIIAIDAGHGMGTAGKRCLKSIDPGETREWYLNDRIADMVETELKKYDCQVLRVDDTTGAKDIALSTRVKAANNAKADMYISIHHNAGINGGTGGGTVVYYYSSAAERLTQARALYNAVVSRTGLRGNRSSTVIKNGFYVIRYTTMPAFLIENGFMDSQADTPVILTQGHAQKTAEGIVAFVVEQLALASAAVQDKLVQSTQYYPACDKKYITISAALTSIGVDSSYTYRKKVAAANSISGYVGTAAQNTQMLNLLKAGLLKRV